MFHTRLANSVTNEFNPAKPEKRDCRICDKYKADFPRAVARTDEPSLGYNCHGLVFAARRTQVWSSSEVQYILREDGYEEIARTEVMPGDVTIYRSTETSEIEHSAIVIGRAKADDVSSPLVLSKWGPCQEFIHPYMDCPYFPTEVSFYRMKR